MQYALMCSVPQVVEKQLKDTVTDLGLRGLTSPPRIFNLVDYTPPTYDGYEFPAWGHAIGWLVAMTSIIAIPIFAFLQILKERSTLKEAS